ncbi:unnamed protein product [Rhizoctonia solani]|uniref:Nephrocystin 3-like N-terminal domain-containing protein n=1 Tax=Rhizoctonia solani TaxID=456999 RepID=A0A8H3DE56_9AGAM|nr:unnamed protein product [Rhizoctonia solani]
MSIRESLSRLKGKLKTRLRIGSSVSLPVQVFTFEGAKALPQVMNTTLDVLRPLKSAVVGLNECISIYERTGNDPKDYGRLLKNIDQLLDEFRWYVQDTGAMEMTRGVEQLCCELEFEVNELRTRLEELVVKQWLKAVDSPSEILQCHYRILGLLKRLTLNADVNIRRKLNIPYTNIGKQAMERRIEHMFPALHLIHRSATSEGITREGCILGTGEIQLASLLDWARRPEAGRIYWLHGVAGTGKTTIAYHVCTGFNAPAKRTAASKLTNVPVGDHTSVIGASFFCSRIMPECHQVENIIPTIAYQLTRYSKPFGHALYSILWSEPDVSSSTLDRQYSKLIVEPLKMVQGSLPTNFIVVIDALDVCENLDSLRNILDLLLSTPDTLPIRFLVTSRLEPEINQHITGQVNEQSNRQLTLHSLDTVVVQADIALFVRSQLEGVPLTNLQQSRLLKQCGVSFIYASTICHFVRVAYESETLYGGVDAIIDSEDSDLKCRDEHAMDQLYIKILKVTSSNSSWTQQRSATALQDILGTVLCAGEQMKLAALAAVLGLESDKQASALLQPLRPVLTLTADDKVEIALHSSFASFLFSRDRSKEFYCEQKKRHRTLARACLEIIETVQPTFNICGLASSYQTDNKVDNLDQRVDKAISPGIAYACRYWSFHLYYGEYDGQLVDIVRRFFSSRLLVWMEVLNLTRQMGFAKGIIHYAERWCVKRLVTEDVRWFALDAGKFVSVYANHPVSQSTPHIYLSMLPFWPPTQPVSIAYMPRTDGIIEPKGTAITGRKQAPRTAWQDFSAGAPVASIGISTDGTRLVADTNDAIHLLDATTGETLLRVQEAETKGVRTVAISPDGNQVAFGNHRGAYRLEISTGAITRIASNQISEVGCICFSPTGSHVVIGSWDNNTYICGSKHGEMILGPLRGHLQGVKSVAYSPDGQHFASGSYDKTIRIWDTKSGQMVGGVLEGHTHMVLSVSYSPDGSRLASASADGTIRVWDPLIGRIILGPLSASDWVLCVNFSPSGAFIAAGLNMRGIQMFNAQSGEIVHGLSYPGSHNVNSVAFAPDSARLFSCSRDGTIRLWNVEDRHVPDTQHPTVPRVFLCVRYSPDGSRVVSGSYDGAVCVWDVQTDDIVLGPLQGHTKPVWGVDYSPDGAYIASASSERALRIWSAQDGKDIHGPIQGHTRDVNCVRFSADSSLLVSGSYDKTVWIWDVQTGQQLNQPLRGHSGRVLSVAFSPNRSHVVSGSSDRTIRVWDIQTGQTVIDPLQGHERPVESVEFSSDGSRILSGSDDKSIRIWDAVTGQSLLVFGQGDGGINSVGFSPNGGLVVSGSSDRTVCVWDAQSGQLMLTLDGHTDWVGSVQISPDGSHVVSCSDDGTIRLWDVSSCQAHVRDDSVKDDGERSDYSHIEAASKPWVLRDDGWVVDRQDRRLVWVPSDLQPYTRHPANDCIVPKDTGLELKFSGVNMGDQWAKCYRA